MKLRLIIICLSIVVIINSIFIAIMLITFNQKYYYKSFIDIGNYESILLENYEEVTILHSGYPESVKFTDQDLCNQIFEVFNDVVVKKAESSKMKNIINIPMNIIIKTKNGEMKISLINNYVRSDYGNYKTNKNLEKLVEKIYNEAAKRHGVAETW